MLGRLADPRKITPDEADRLAEIAKPIYWATGAINSPETGSPEMLMELAYRLAVEESVFIRDIRRNAIVMITPIIEVDGRAEQVDLHMAPRRDPDYEGPSRPLYWGRYVAHENNRDGIGLSLELSQHVTRTFLEYHPQIMHDLHEFASHLYPSTGRGPYNAWLDPITINDRGVGHLTAVVQAAADEAAFRRGRTGTRSGSRWTVLRPGRLESPSAWSHSDPVVVV